MVAPGGQFSAANERDGKLAGRMAVTALNSMFGKLGTDFGGNDCRLRPFTVEV